MNGHIRKLQGQSGRGNAMENRNNIIVVFCVIVVVVVLGIVYFCNVVPKKSTEKILAPPKINITVRHDGFLEDVVYNDSPAGEVVAIDMSDNVLYYLGSGEQGNKDVIVIRVDEREETAEQKTSLSLSGGIERETLDDSIILNNQDFSLGQTEFTITASNSVGESHTTVVVDKTNVADECEKYSVKYNGSFAELVDSVEYYCEAWESQVNKQSTSKSDKATEFSASSLDATNPSCLHYEAGRCWDDLEMEAYSQGQYDKNYGRYGDSYYEGDDCDEVCRDILEDAYSQGYEDY